MSRSRAVGLALISTSVIILTLGLIVSLDDGGDLSIGLPIVGLGIGFLVGGIVAMRNTSSGGA